MLSAKEQVLRELPDLLWAARAYRAVLKSLSKGIAPSPYEVQKLKEANAVLDSYEPARDDEGCCNTFVGKDLGDE